MPKQKIELISREDIKKHLTDWLDKELSVVCIGIICSQSPIKIEISDKYDVLESFLESVPVEQATMTCKVDDVITIYGSGFYIHIGMNIGWNSNMTREFSAFLGQIATCYALPDIAGVLKDCG